MRPAACLATAVTKFFQCWSVPVPSQLRSLGGAHPAEPYRQLESLRLEDGHAGVPAMVKIRSAFLDWAAAIQLSKAFQSYTPFDVLMRAQRVPVFQSRRLVTGTAGHGRTKFLVKLINFAGIGCGGGVSDCTYGDKVRMTATTNAFTDRNNFTFLPLEETHCDLLPNSSGLTIRARHRLHRAGGRL